MNTSRRIAAAATALALAAGTAAGITTAANAVDDGYTDESLTPVVTSADPYTVPTGGYGAATFTGTNLYNADGSRNVTAVRINGITEPITGGTRASDGTQTVTVAQLPKAPAGTTDVTFIYNNDLEVTESNILEYYGPPTVVKMSPDSGPVSGGTIITILGTNLAPVYAVEIGDKTYDRDTFVQAANTMLQIQTRPSTVAGPTDIVLNSFVADYAPLTLVGAFDYKATVPAAPATATAEAGNSSADVTWTAPAFDGASPITGYAVTSSPGDGGCNTTASETSCTIDNLTNDQAYTFTVVADNAVGTSDGTTTHEVTPSESVTVTVPGAPTNVTATASDESATISWSAPATNGGATITGYAVTSSPGDGGCNTTASETSCTIDNLTNDQEYTFTIKARNSAGWSEASTASATPSANPVDPSPEPEPIEEPPTPPSLYYSIAKVNGIPCPKGSTPSWSEWAQGTTCNTTVNWDADTESYPVSYDTIEDRIDTYQAKVTVVETRAATMKAGNPIIYKGLKYVVTNTRTLLFDKSTQALTPAGKQAANKIRKAAASNPLAKIRLRASGATPPARAKYARSVITYLTDHGVDRDRITVAAGTESGRTKIKAAILSPLDGSFRVSTTAP